MIPTTYFPISEKNDIRRDKSRGRNASLGEAGKSYYHSE